MKHKHYKMICAKAANMDLVLFRKTPSREIWETCRRDWMPTDLQDEYFLCLPQHKDACLHWLNCGSIQNKYAIWVGVEDCNGNFEWSDRIVFMLDTVELRIKPSKEKRWIATFAHSRDLHFVVPQSFDNIESLVDYVHMNYGHLDGVQYLEIEVEVAK